MSVMDSLENIGTIIKSKQLKIYDIVLEDGTKKENFNVPFDRLGINISEDFSWSQNYDEILDYLDSKYKDLVRDFRYDITKSSTPYLRDKKGLGDREVEHIISSTKKILDRKLDTTAVSDRLAKIIRELETAHLMYKSGQNYSYAIGRMQKYLKLYIEEMGTIEKIKG